MLKKSAFTLLFPSFNQMGIVYNSATGKLCLLNEYSHGIARAVLWRPNYPYRKADYRKIREEFLEKGFLVEDQRDELKQLQILNQKARKDRSEFGLTLAPTNNCNLACVYCYQGKHEDVTWTESDEEAVFEFICRRLPSESALFVTWYGGEPLLALPMVLRLSARLKELARSRRCTWACDMVTNGTLLTPAAAESLAQIGCSNFQITLDGPQEINDKLRRSRDGTSAFHLIMGNILEMDLAKVSIGIRVNLMKDNIAAVGDLVRQLASLGLAGKIHVSLAPIEALGKSCYAVSKRCISGKGFADCHFEFVRRLDEEGFSPNCLPHPIESFCGAFRENSFVIDWNGDVFKCWNDVGLREKRIGNVHSPAGISIKGTCLADHNPFQDQECRKCPILPVCMGGCPAVAASTGSFNKACRFYKHRFADYLNFHVYKHLRQEPPKREPETSA
jgi:uncharacterized protein